MLKPKSISCLVPVKTMWITAIWKALSGCPKDLHNICTVCFYIKNIMNNNYRIKLLLEGYFINNLNVFNMQKKPCRLYIIIIGSLWWIHIIKLLITKPVSGSNFKISNSFKLQSSSLEHSDVAKRSIYVTVARLRRRRGNDNGKRP